MRQQGKRIRGMTTGPLLGLLSSLMLLGACRIRRERPEPQPAPQNSAETVSGAQEAGIALAPDSDASPPTSAQMLAPTTPVQAPEGVLVVAATSADVTAGSIKCALDSVRLATLRLLEGVSGSAATASGLVPFERALDVPVAQGAPLRRGNDRPQCDAVLIDTQGRLFGVGAVADVESPARLALEVLERNWGFVVGDGAQGLAAEIGVAEQRWSPGVERQEIEATEAAMDAGTAESVASRNEIAVTTQNIEPIDAGSTMSVDDAGTLVSVPNMPSMAVVMLRDREGRFFVAAEDCGVKEDPVGQLTTLAKAGTASFVGEQGAVFVAGSHELAHETRHAERIYRRLLMLQVPKIAADWGLRTSEGATMVIIVSRLGSAIASSRPVVWARNHSDGESYAQLPLTDAESAAATPLASGHSGHEGNQHLFDPQKRSIVDSSLPASGGTSRPSQQNRRIESVKTKAADQFSGAPGSEGSALAPKSKSLVPRTSAKDAGHL